jgi:hypothetical protein
LALLVNASVSQAQSGCPGDCNRDLQVTVSELVTQVSMALDQTDMSACEVADADDDGRVAVNELVVSVNTLLRGCTVPPTPTPTPDPCTEGTATTFNSTFEAIQKVVFEKYSCSESVCHGSLGMQGGLDLSPEVAYDNIFEKPALGVSMNLIQPGDKDRSYLWLKLAAKTDPSKLPAGFQIAGAPMPNSALTISDEELEAMRLWIYAGAPEEGTVDGTAELLNACLPPPEPIFIEPLDPPAPGTGVQLVMPEWPLEAHSEREICFATYYDITDQVPEEYRDPTGTMFRFATSELRQDPQSHHLIINRQFGVVEDLHHQSFGAWTCAGGERAGETCEPSDLSSCGTGHCRSEVRDTFACIGFGQPGSQRAQIGGAQSAQSFNEYAPGVYGQIPMKGVLYWNSHAFNLTGSDTVMHGWMNYYFSDDQRYPVRGIFDASRIFAANAAPFTTQTICHNHLLPQNAHLFNMSSHTHKHGKHFTVTMPDGSTIYESFVYNDPEDITFDPPLVFDSPNPADRTLRFCSLYNNGVKADGSPDVNLVTRSSRVPPSAQFIGRCSPVACVSGKIGARCNGTGDDRTCDSSPGANDGFCDACNITGGESTENEMFILIGAYYIPTSGAAGGDAGPTLDWAAD